MMYFIWRICLSFFLGVTPYDALLADMQAEFPGLKVVPKASSRLMHLMEVLLWPLLGSAFSERFTTVVGQTIYVPVDWAMRPEIARLGVLRHERVHLRQAKRYGRILFTLAYLLFPLPLGLAWCRARLEWEAYEESMRAAFEYYGKGALNAEHRAYMVGHFTGPSYGWMWPFRTQVERWYDEARARILAC